MSVTRQKFEKCFQKTVPVAFGFLESKFGFTLTRKTVWEYVGESPYLRIRVMSDTGQLIIVSFTPKKYSLNSAQIPSEIGLGIIIPCLYPSVGYNSRFCRNIKDFELEINKSAELLNRYCIPFLNGDFSDWEKVEACAKKVVQEWRMQSEMRIKNAPTQEENRIRKIRARAEEAFHAKDYVQAIDLYESIEKVLSELEIKKLDYMKHANNL
jgi:hypothetical protein